MAGIYPEAGILSIDDFPMSGRRQIRVRTDPNRLAQASRGGQGEWLTMPANVGLEGQCIRGIGFTKVFPAAFAVFEVLLDAGRGLSVRLPVHEQRGQFLDFFAGDMSRPSG